MTPYLWATFLSIFAVQVTLPNRGRYTIAIFVYRVRHLLANLGWVDLCCSTLCLVLSGKLADLAEHVVKMVEHPKSKSTQPRFARRCLTL